MRGDRLLPMAMAAVAALLMSLPGSALAGPAHPENDVFNDLNAVGATQDDAPYTGAPHYSFESVIYDNTDFDIESAEAADAAGLLACADPTPDVAGDADWGSKDAWLHFRTASAGRIVVDIDSSVPGPSGYDVFYKVYTTTKPPGAASYGDLHAVDCFNRDNSTLPDETYFFGYPIPADTSVYIQTLSICNKDASGPAYQCTAGQQSSAPGGQTQIKFTFTPDNADGDNVPDSLDSCPGSAGSQPNGCNPTPPPPPPADPDNDGVRGDADSCPLVSAKTSDGCPDSDRDGVSDRVDIACKLIPGNSAVGCPTLLNVDSSVLFALKNHRWTVRRLEFDADRGSSVEVRCRAPKRQRRRCFKGAKRIKKTTKERNNVGRFFRKRKLPVGTVIDVSIRKSLFKGKRIRYRLGKRSYQRKASCILATGKACPKALP